MVEKYLAEGFKASDSVLLSRNFVRIAHHVIFLLTRVSNLLTHFTVAKLLMSCE